MCNNCKNGIDLIDIVSIETGELLSLVQVLSSYVEGSDLDKTTIVNVMKVLKDKCEKVNEAANSSL